MFPDDFFEPIELRKETIEPHQVQSSQVEEDYDMETMVVEDSQIPMSQQVEKALITKKVAATGKPESKLFLERLVSYVIWSILYDDTLS